MPTYEHLKYNNNKIQVDSAIRDGNGAQIDTTYAKKADISYQYINAQVEFTSTPSGDAFLSTYPYRGTFQSDRISANTYASITLSDAQSKSGMYAPFCVTGSHVLYVYARVDVGTVIFPTINLGGGASAITMDYTPVEGGLNPITSGGVYTALSGKADITALTDGSVTKLGTASVGSDAKPIKLVNGVATAITKDVLTVDGGDLNHNKYITGRVSAYNTPFRVASTDGNNNIYALDIYDNQGNKLIGLYVTWDSTNGARLNAVKRKANGDYSYPTIVA